MKNLFIYGAPASGKSTLARALADALKAESFDLDAVIVEEAKKPISRIFAEEGEGAFRAQESAALRGLVERHPSDAIIALGGGTLLRDENRSVCEANGLVLCLDTPSDEELARRLRKDGAVRPLGNKAVERAAHYASFPHRIASFASVGDSLVLVGSGFASAILDGRHLVVDSHVAELYPQIAAAPCAVIPTGEQHKTVETVLGLWQSFRRAGLGRRDRVAALGGGVTGDLTGFAAATWMRGIDWINVPTTLLAMVDASTGGKTGCDLPEGKNLVGAFHTPRLVAIDADFLKTLPPVLLAAGHAEMIKHAVIGGKDVLPASALPTPAEIAANLGVKIGIVREDPYERLGRRILLNCGHTIAHAIEQTTGYAVSHGEAVAMGCVAEARLAVRLQLAPEGWPEELAAVFAAAGLPVERPPELTSSRLVPVMRGDKKRAGSVVTFALPCGWGDVRAVPIDLTKEIEL